MAGAYLKGLLNPAGKTTESIVEPSAAVATLETVDAKGNPDGLPATQRIYLECHFNPAQLSITKKVTWSQGKLIKYRNTPDLDFGGGEPATFSLDLVFDTTRTAGALTKTEDVRVYTNQLFRLVMLFGKVEERVAPPRVMFKWGEITLFLAVVTQVQVTYTLFLPDGTPVRAKAKVDFTQMDARDDYTTNPTTRTEPRKTRLVQQGERLDSIAYQEYGHPSHWRYLAEVNNMLDPRDLRPGQILVIPPLP